MSIYACGNSWPLIIDENVLFTIKSITSVKADNNILKQMKKLSCAGSKHVYKMCLR